MNQKIEIENTDIDLLENNIEQIGEIAKQKGMVILSFSENMPETNEINDTLLSVGFLKENMSLNQFSLATSTDDGNSFEFGLCFGTGKDNVSGRRISWSLQFIRDEREGDTVIRIFEEEGKKPISHMHCLSQEGLNKLSRAEKKVLEVLTLTFLECT